MPVLLPRASCTDDYYYYTWQAATHGTEINAPLGQIGSEAYAYADVTGLIKVKVIGGLGWIGHVKAWGSLYLTIQGVDENVVPKISYAANGLKLNSWWLIINLTIIEVDTGNTVMSMSDVIPHGGSNRIMVGSKIYLSSAKEYLFWLYIEAIVSININANQVIDYYDDNMGRKIQVNFLWLDVFKSPPRPPRGFGGGGGRWLLRL